MQGVRPKALTRIPGRLGLATLAVSAALLAMGAGPAYQVAAPIAGPDGGWDYASVDPNLKRLYVARTDSVTAFDLANGAVMPAFAPAAHGHAALPIPDGRTLLITNGDDASVSLVDKLSGAPIARIAVGQKPDAAIWDAKRRLAVVMNAKDGRVMLIDVAKAMVVGEIALKPGLEFAAFDAEGRLFVNNEDENTLTAVDLDKRAIIAEIPLTGCVHPSGLAYAPLAKRFVSACGNGVAAITDPAVLKSEATFPIGKGPDAVLSDPRRQRLFIPAGGDGVLDVFVDSAKGLQPGEAVTTEKGARTGAVDPASGTIYLPTAAFEPPAPGERRGRPTPGSFHLVVVKPN